MNEKPLPTSHRERLNVRTRNVDRGNFRLHPRGPLGVSLGCITLHTELISSLFGKHYSLLHK
nr:tlde1 domain-containing protein [uncultured Pantoea sp.]